MYVKLKKKYKFVFPLQDKLWNKGGNHTMLYFLH